MFDLGLFMVAGNRFGKEAGRRDRGQNIKKKVTEKGWKKLIGKDKNMQTEMSISGWELAAGWGFCHELSQG